MSCGAERIQSPWPSHAGDPPTTSPAYLVDNFLLLGMLLTKAGHLPPQGLVFVLHGQELGVHTLLFPLHQLHICQQPGDTVLAYFYVLTLQGGHAGHFPLDVLKELFLAT